MPRDLPDDRENRWFHRDHPWPWVEEQMVEDMTPGANDERYSEVPRVVWLSCDECGCSYVLDMAKPIQTCRWCGSPQDEQREAA